MTLCSLFLNLWCWFRHFSFHKGQISQSYQNSAWCKLTYHKACAGKFYLRLLKTRTTFGTLSERHVYISKIWYNRINFIVTLQSRKLVPRWPIFLIISQHGTRNCNRTIRFTVLHTRLIHLHILYRPSPAVRSSTKACKQFFYTKSNVSSQMDQR